MYSSVGSAACTANPVPQQASRWRKISRLRSPAKRSVEVRVRCCPIIQHAKCPNRPTHSCPDQRTVHPSDLRAHRLGNAGSPSSDAERSSWSSRGATDYPLPPPRCRTRGRPRHFGSGHVVATAQTESHAGDSCLAPQVGITGSSHGCGSGRALGLWIRSHYYWS